MSDSYKAYLADIGDFKPDAENANNHTLRGRSLVHKGMEKRGYARPAFAAKDGTVLGGNLSTLDVAVDIGLGEGKVLVVETDGRLPIIHKRVDVEPGTEEARMLALEDNRTAEISLSWDAGVLVDFMEQGLDITGLWDETELSVMLEGAAADWDSAFDGVPDGDRAPFQQMTFTLHDSQAERIQEALKVAQKQSDFAGSPNQNSNGNALAFICEAFLNG